MLHGLLDHLLEGRHIDIGELLDVQAAFAKRVLAELRAEFGVRLDDIHVVKSQGLAARRKPDDHVIAFASAGVLIVIAAEADNAAAPHLRLHAGGFFHEVNHGDALRAVLFVGNAR